MPFTVKHEALEHVPGVSRKYFDFVGNRNPEAELFCRKSEFALVFLISDNGIPNAKNDNIDGTRNIESGSPETLLARTRIS